MVARGLAIVAVLVLTGCDCSGGNGGGDAGADGDVFLLLTIPEPAMLPVSENEVLYLGPGLFLDEASTFLLTSDGSMTLVYESFQQDRSFSELWIITSPDGRRAALPRPIGLITDPYEASPSFLDGTLHFIGADALLAAPTLFRERLGRGEPLPSIEGVGTIDSAPRLHRWGDRVAVVFRDGAARPMFAVGASASSFETPLALSEEPVGSAALGIFADGTLAYAYEHPVGEAVLAFVLRSSDGVQFTDPVPISDAIGDVHDTALVARADGGLDLYYVVMQEAGNAALFRRAYFADGAMGVEERVTLDTVGDLKRPQGVRLASGRVVIAFVDIYGRGPTGEPTRQQLVLTSLPGEALAP